MSSSARPGWVASRIAQRRTADLLPYARNARTHSPDQVAAIAASIREFGFVNPILVDESGEIIAGHGRVLAAKTLGMATVPTIVRAGLSDTQKRALRLADNKIALNSSWDDEMLAAELAALAAEDGFDFSLTGFSDADLAALTAADEPPPPPPSLEGDDPADAEVAAPRARVTSAGDLWCMGPHRLLCGDSTSAEDVTRLMNGTTADLLFTSPPYGQQRNYTTGGIGDWDALMQGVFLHAAAAMAPAGQIVVNLGMTHHDSEWHPYWQGWVEWMRTIGWRRFGWYVWDQGPGLPGDWNGRLAPSFEFLFHFNRHARQANKIIESKWAGDPLLMSGLRKADGSMSGNSHHGRDIQPFRIPDNVIRITRHKARGIEIEHPAVFAVRLPEFLMHAYTAPGERVWEPFSGSGTTIIAAQRAARVALAMELAPEYVDLTVARWRLLNPDIPVTLDGDGRTYDEIAQERARG